MGNFKYEIIFFKFKILDLNPKLKLVIFRLVNSKLPTFGFENQFFKLVELLIFRRVILNMKSIFEFRILDLKFQIGDVKIEIFSFSLFTIYV